LTVEINEARAYSSSTVPGRPPPIMTSKMAKQARSSSGEPGAVRSLSSKSFCR
jgi:hypothetical protein